MKILMLVPFLPNTLSGGQTRWYNIIKKLSKRHEITLLSLIKEDEEKKFIPELEKYCKKVLVFKRPKSPWTFRNLFLTAFSLYPLVVIRNLSPEEKRAIKKELALHKYDLIHAETFYVMPHVPKTQIPIVLVEPTIEFSVYQHYLNNEVPLLLKPLFMYDVLKLRFWEKHYWKKANRLFAVSEEDEKIMEKEAPGIKVGVVPNGIDTQYFEKKKISKKDPPRILYIGNYKWMQNVEAVDLLIKKIWPRIKRKIPNVKLWIVGVNIPEKIVAFSKNKKDIEITESIPDIRDAYKASSALIAPIKGPGGTRLKVLEAMASGLPVISTSVGVSGLGLKSGEHALVEDSIKGIVEKTVKVLKDKEYAKKIGNNGKEFVSKHYDWENIVDNLDNIYSDVLS